MSRLVLLLVLMATLLAGCGGSNAGPVDKPATATPVPSPIATTIARNQPTLTAVPRNLEPTTTALPAVLGRNEKGSCQITVPAGFAPISGEPGRWTDRTANLAVEGLAIEERDFAAFTLKIPAQLLDQHGGKIVRVTQSADRYRADFVPASIPTGKAGMVAFIPLIPGAVCLAMLIYPPGQEALYQVAADTVATSVKAITP